MENLTLTSGQYKAITRYFALASIFAFVLVMAASYKTANLSSASSTFVAIMRWMSTAVTICAGLFWLFYKYVWRWWILPQLLGRPVIRGVWIGRLTSDFSGDELGAAPATQIPIVFVVRQTFLTISIQSFTERQTGESRVEALLLNSRTEHFRLAYVFELKNEYPGKNSLTNGAGDLRLYGKRHDELNGQYWTDSPTHGTIDLRKVDASYKGIQRFEDAQLRWPDHAGWSS